VVIQRRQSHCSIKENKEADDLAKKGGELTQMYMGVSFKEAKILIKRRYKGKWEKEHQGYYKEEGYYHLNREELVTVFRLRTGHNRLSIYSASSIHHLLQMCPTYKAQREQI
jgi:hypothetical protein